MSSLWFVLALLVVIAGLRYLHRLRRARSGARASSVDDDAVREIIETGSLTREDDDEPLDLDAAARAEEEFWNESWDEPDEYGP